MPKTKISEFSATPANNTDIDSINIAEGCAPSGINDAIRELMSQLKDFQTGAVGDSFNGPVGSTTASTGAFTTLSASSTVSGTGFSTYLASPPAIGGTAAAAVSATTLAASGAVTLSGGTANGVTYLNGSKVLTSGSALTFDGTNLGVGVASPTYLIDGGATNPRVRLTATSTGYSTSQFANSSGSSFFGRDSSAGSFFGIANGTVVYSSSNDPIGFFLGTNEQMRLTSTGLGIGTSSPATKLHVEVSGASSIITNKGTSANYYGYAGSTLVTQLLSSSTQTLLNSVANVPIIFSTNDTERMRLDSTGNLGLGVTPSAWSTGKAFEVGNAGNSFWNLGAAENHLTTNAYYNAGWKFGGTGYAQKLTTISGQYQFNVSTASGTAGTAISFTQAMTLDASGNLGVGTTSPAYKIDARLSGTSSGAVIQVGNTGSGGFGGLGVSDGGAYPVQMWGSALTFLTGSSTYGSATERARIDSSGNLLVNSTSTLDAVFSVTARSGITACSLRVATNGDYGYTFKNASNTFVGAIGVNSSSTSYVTSSDYRLKNTITPMTGALAKVALLKPVTYKWNVDGSDSQGFIAHELAEVVPECVTGEKDAVDAEGNPKYQGIDTSFLVATLTAAIQEQQAIIQSLKARLDAANL